MRNMSLARLQAKIARLPLSERNLPIVVVNNYSLSWNAILQEASTGTEIGIKALNELITRGLI